MKIQVLYKFSVLLLFACFMHTPKAAEEQAPWYQVEIILFSYPGADMSREKWPDDPGAPDLGKFVEILDNNELAPLGGAIAQALSNLTPDLAEIIPRPYTFLEKEKLLLTREAAAIRRSSSRKLLLHAGWLQPGLSKDKAPEILIKSGKQFTIGKLMFPIAKMAEKNAEKKSGSINSNNIPVDERGVTANGPVANTTANENITTETSLPQPGVDPFIIQSVHEVEGIIQISISRYLHIQTDLMNYRPELVADSNDPTKKEKIIRAYRFQDHRRMRSKELHYIDNPAFGLLVQIVPYELPKRGEQAQGSSKP